jgi:archaellum biogenesis ATPase FlaH
MWNASVSKLFLKDKSLEAKFTAFDLLKQNRAINRTVQETYIEDSRSNVLAQYFMVSIRYNLNKFGGKGAKSFSMPKIPGMRQMGNMRIGM